MSNKFHNWYEMQKRHPKAAKKRRVMKKWRNQRKSYSDLLKLYIRTEMLDLEFAKGYIWENTSHNWGGAVYVPPMQPVLSHE